MKHQIHFALQIVPITKTRHPYEIIDKAIDVIKQSGLRYEVGPMETVIEGDYETILKVVTEAQEICLREGADEIVVTMKLHARREGDVTWDEKNTGVR